MVDEVQRGCETNTKIVRRKVDIGEINFTGKRKKQVSDQGMINHSFNVREVNRERIQGTYQVKPKDS